MSSAGLSRRVANVSVGKTDPSLAGGQRQSSEAHKPGTDDAGGLVAAFRRAMRAIGLLPNGHTMRNTLEELIEEEEVDAVEIDSHERTLIRNVLGLRDISARDVMVPRADIVAVDAETTIQDLVSQMIEAAHSRLPVYRETLDDTIGLVHIKDVLGRLASAQPTTVPDLVREALFVSPTIRALDLLQEMRLNRRHLALVVDEFGGIDGLITIEDLVEEIVGEIIDEHDVEEGPKIVAESDGTAVADARATVKEVESLFGLLLSDTEREEVDTVAGLIFAVTGRIAKRGEIIRHESGLEFEIIDADPRRLKTVRVRRPTDPSDDVAP
ncbi:hemolysin family protein [Alphaproteobacteria bacterium]|nr:hemolysin family protein [Alphaproteobacteria bacterium]